MMDPTRSELIAFLEGQYPAVTCGEHPHTEDEAERDDHDGCGCRFDIEEAAYWIAADYHGGQWSSLYSALSTSPYSPGPGECSLADGVLIADERFTAAELYACAAAWIEGRYEGMPEGQ
jgi:hypothetical protein